MLYLERSVKGHQEDVPDQRDFFLNKVLKAFSFIYSIGAPVPKVFNQIEHILPTYIVARDGTPEEIDELFAHYGDHMVASLDGPDGRIYTGDDIWVVVGGEVSGDEIGFAIFAHSFKRQLYKILEIHRSIWQEVDDVRKYGNVHLKELADISDTLTDLKNESLFFKSRLAQMGDFVIARKAIAAHAVHMETLRKDVDQKLVSLSSAHRYFVSLWQMTIDYLDNTLNLVDLLHDENQEKELNTLQIMFVVGAVASFITLGAVSGFAISFFDASGRLLTRGEAVSFNLVSFVKFGSGAIVASAILYYLLHVSFVKIKNFRLVRASRFRMKAFDEVKKRLG